MSQPTGGIGFLQAPGSPGTMEESDEDNQDNYMQEDLPSQGPEPDTPMTEQAPSTSQSPVDLLTPEMNKYEDVKSRFEVEVCKILSPFTYLYLPKDRSGQQENTKPDQLSAKNLKDLFENLYYYAQIPNKKTNKLEWDKLKFIARWMGDEHVRQYTRIVVDPQNANPSNYNLWRPFKASLLPPVPDEDVPGLVQMFVDHVHVVYAKNDIVKTDFILDHMCNIVQRPHQKTNVALHFAGKEGVGKGILWAFLRTDVLGDHVTTQSDNPEHDVFSRFANKTVNNVLIQIDEVTGKLKELHDRMKNLITSDTINYEKKGHDSVTVRNYTNLVLTTNNPNVLLVTANDRRYVLFDCAQTYMNNTDYKVRLGNHLQRPEVARAFYQFAMQRDLSKYVYDFQPFRPVTELYKESQQMSIPPISRFLSALTNMDYTAPTQAHAMQWADGFINPTAKTMFKAFQDFQTEGNCKTSYSNIYFFRQLSRYEGVTHQRTMAFRFYRINIVELKQFLVSSNEYDEDASID